MRDDQKTCPVCGSDDLSFHQRRGKWTCQECNHQFVDAVVEDRAEEGTDPTAQSALLSVPSEKLRLFLSYGHDDNEELVRRIKADLERRGHDVWFDREQIEHGDDWRRSITDGIEQSHRVLSFLSKYSTRDPGVCLDEIGIAVGVKGGNIQTILVESESEVKAPPTIGHLQWLDMHDWHERIERTCDDWGPWYQKKLREILRVVESDESRRFAGEIEQLRDRLAPITSASRIAALLKKGFVGRAWLHEAVERWRTEESTSRLLWIVGEPGVGKSAFAAHLTHFGRDRVAAAQFVEWDQPDHRNPHRVVRNLAFQLATRLPDYRKLLLGLPELGKLDGKTPEELFTYLLAEPLSHGIDGGHQRLLVVIDALDEATDSGNHRNPLVEMLARHAHRLPEWLGFVVTSRPESEVKAALQGLHPVELDTRTEANREDVRTYLRNQLAASLATRNDADALVARILEASEGVFQYVERFCEDVRLGNLSLDRPDEFPQGLGGIYLQWFLRQFPDMEDFRKRVRPVLRAVLAAREPLPLQLARQLFPLPEEDFHDLLRSLGSMFPVTGPSDARVIKSCHKSLSDWLLDETRSHDFYVSSTEGHRLLADAGMREYARGKAPSLYYSKHLIGHLCRLHDWENLIHLLSDDNFLATINNMIAVYDISEVAILISPQKYINILLNIPERYLNFCDMLRETNGVAKNGLLPPVESIGSQIRALDNKIWKKSDYLAHLKTILLWYSTSLDIGIRFTSNGLWDISRLNNLLLSSKDYEIIIHQFWEKDYNLESGNISQIVNYLQTLREKCFDLIRLKILLRKSDPAGHTFLKFSCDHSDAKTDIGVLQNSIIKHPKWHPQPAEFYKTMGPQEDYAEVYRFPCCGCFIVTGGAPPSQYLDNGCEVAPEKYI